MDLALIIQAQADLATICRRLRDLRKAAGLTQIELGDSLGVTDDTVCNREKGRKGMPAVDLIAHARALGARIVLEDLDD